MYQFQKVEDILLNTYSVYYITKELWKYFFMTKNIMSWK